MYDFSVGRVQNQQLAAIRIEDHSNLLLENVFLANYLIIEVKEQAKLIAENLTAGTIVNRFEFNLTGMGYLNLIIQYFKTPI